MEKETSSRVVEPIAIIGFGFKFPQDITNAESLWKLLMERRSTMTKIPSNRWNIDGFYKDHGHRPGTVKNRGGHFLADDPARFDAPFFSIQPAEAECMDPQQRLLLETSYHALENAGIPMQSAMGTRTSVHVGCLLQEYSQISQRDSQMPGDYRIVGSSGLAMLANRLSWFYDFSGPSMTVDTACSGGLVAFHLACQELLAGSVDMSLVCGNNLCLLPDSTALLSSLNMMSKDSVCYSFDERAGGYARGEGFGCLILKRLSQAIADGDTIRGVVRSTGVGQDGNTPSITSPSQTAQERLIRETYARAGLDLNETRYFEAHGTGTPVGDPCEAAAINNVFSTRTSDDPMFVGALKSNMGHPEGASGIAGVIKTILVLEKGIIPPNVYPERINPAVAVAGPNLKFPLEAAVWPIRGVRRASVNSFGYGGTNAHVVIDDALSFLTERGLDARHCTNRLEDIQETPKINEQFSDSASSDGSSYDTPTSDTCPSDMDDDQELAMINMPTRKLLVLSAFDERALQRYMHTLDGWTRRQSEGVDISALAYTLSEKRTSFPWKSVCVASANSISHLPWSAPTRVKPRVTVGLVFTGQGAQWHGMGRQLMKYEVFHNSLMDADTYFKSLGSTWSLLDELYKKSKSESVIHQPELSQPVCTALQVAIVELLSSWNVRAAVTVGHSSGEIASAFASGAISRESAWMIAYFRGLAVSITQVLCEPVSAGAMIAVQAPLDFWISMMNEHNTTSSSNSQVAIACYNSTSSFTVSGPRDSIHRFSATLKEAGIEVHVLKVNVPYHSHHMEPVAKVYRKLIRHIDPGVQADGHAQFVSTVTGEAMSDLSALRTAEYWNQNLTGSVKFAAATQCISDRQNPSTAADVLIEIGPHSVLRSPLNDTLKISGRNIATDYTSILRRNQPADLTALECAGKLLTAGVSVDIAAVNHYAASAPKLLTSLPSYQFEDKKKYWLEGRTSIQYRQTKFVHHELLGLRTPDWNEHEARWTNRILLDQSPYLKDHVINGLCLMPAAGMLSMAIEAVRQFYGEKIEMPASGYKLKDVTFTKAMTLSADTRGTEIQLTLRTSTNTASWDHFSLYVYEDDHWHLCCAGSIKVEYSHHEAVVYEKKQALLSGLEDCRVQIPSSEIYDAFNKAELAYGPTFKGMKNVTWNPQGQAAGIVGLHDWEAYARHRSDPHFIHPAGLDSILQMTFPAYSIYAKNASATTLPTGFNNAWFSADLANTTSGSNTDVLVHAKVIGRGFRNKLFAVTAAMDDSKDICFYGELETTTIGRSSSAKNEKEPSRSLYRVDWQPVNFDEVAMKATRSGEPKSTVHVIYDGMSPTQRDLVRCLSETFLSQNGLGTVLIQWQSLSEYNLKDSLCIFLPGLDGNLLRHISEDDLQKIKTLISTVDALLWITFQHSGLDQSPTEGLVSGVVRTLATESDEYRLVSVSLEAKSSLDAVSANILNVAQTLIQHVTDPEDEFCEIDGKLCVPRVIDDRELTAQVLPEEQSTATVSKPWRELDGPKLTIGAAGILSTLHYEQAPLIEAELGPDEVHVEVKAVGLNSRDFLVALGQVHDEAFGSEFAGVVLQIGSSPAHGFQIGDRVFGVARDATAKTVRCAARQLQKIPENIDFISAAAYIVVYCTAYYSLVQFARIQKSDSVFISHGAGALGQAAIRIAQLHECQIFATVSSAEEKAFVCDTYGIPETHLFLSPDMEFANTVHDFTNRRGVDVILSQRSGEAASKLWTCVAPFGRFVEVVEKDAFHSTANGSKETVMPANNKNVTLASINFEELSQSNLFANIFSKVVRLIEDGSLMIANPLVVFSQNEVEAAFRELQRDNHVGKVVVEMKEHQLVEMELAPDTKALFQENATYLIAGAFGGIGQDISRWMVQNGARHLILPSRSAVDETGSDREKYVQELRAQGAIVKAPVCDIADEHQVHKMIQELHNLPPIKGCVQAAMMMQDSSFANMTIDKWRSSLAPKVDGSWNLHHLLPSNLDFFVMLSSSTGIMGSFGQSNYTAGNTYQEAIASHRMSHGQRAHTLALSMVTGVGYVAQNEQVQALLRVRGMLEEVPMSDIHALLRFCCDPQRVDASGCGSQIITPLTLPADLRAMGIVAPLGSTRPMYSYLDTLPSRFSADSLTTEAKKRPAHLLGEATSMVQAIDIVTDAIQTQLSSLLVVSKEDIDTQKAIYRYGVDSLVAVEMRNWFAKAIGADVSTVDVMSDISIWLLAVKVAAKSKFVKDEVKEA